MTAKPKVDYSVVWREKQYLKMICANIVSRFGDSIDAVAFGWLVYQLTDSPEWLAIILGINMVPTVLLQPFAGVWINYLNKKAVLVLCDLGRGILVLLIAVLYLAGVLNPWILIVITLLNSSLEALRIPCGLAVMQKVLSKENRSVCMAANQGASRASELIGMGLSGVIIAVFGVGGAILIDALTFLGSSAVLSRLRFTDNSERVTNSYWGEMRSGLVYYRGNAPLVAVTLLCCLINLVESPILNLKAAYIGETLQLGADALSVGSLALSVGMCLGAVVYPFLASRLSTRQVFILCGAATGVFYLWQAALPLLPGEISVLTLYGLNNLLFGINSTSINLALSVTMINNVEDAYMARVGGVFNAVACTTLPVMSFFTAVLVSFLSIQTLFVCLGVLSIVLFLALLGSRTTSALK